MKFLSVILLFAQVLSICSLSFPVPQLPINKMMTQQKWNRQNGGHSIRIKHVLSVATSPLASTGVHETLLPRRNFMMAASMITLSIINGLPTAVYALPMVSTEEFNTIIRDSARSIDVVEFSGPKSETVKVILVDGTTFGINDVIESSTDPRSPLKVAAMCKANQIPYKFVNIEAVLNASSRKKKVYTNARVLEAAKKEKEKTIRMEQDEELRQQQLREMQ
jgi:hypothetical protein